ncbi:hypothetical protein [Streptomyces sp. ID05-47C]|uniref:hypothetical protein n=1 Tax=Streptomyces sp. ID05-47C TaxID=3028665 RepID=UPI0039F4BD99
MDQDLLASDEAASLVGAAMISVLVLPLPATRLRSTAGDASREQAAHGTAKDAEVW